jgi:hypothetical protein
MTISCNQDQTVLQRDGGDPQIVIRNWSANVKHFAFKVAVVYCRCRVTIGHAQMSREDIIFWEFSATLPERAAPK